MDGNVSWEFKGRPLPDSLKVYNLAFAEEKDHEVDVFHVEPLDMSAKVKLATYIGGEAKITYKKLDKSEFTSFSSNTDDDDHTDVEQLWDKIFNDAVAQNASDIHIFSSPSDARILFRIWGSTVTYESDTVISPQMTKRLIRSIYSSLTGDTGSNKNSFSPIRTQSATVLTQKTSDGKRFRLRYQDALLDGDDNNIHATLRLLEQDKDLNFDLTRLGFELDQQEIAYNSLMGIGGITIIAGATGDGKTTTAATMLAKIAEKYKGSKNIITIEDPVEFKIPGVNHTQVQQIKKENDQLELVEEAWERHLAALLRRDPDIVLQGEMRTKATAACAVNTALTGHATMVTVHANSTFDALIRCGELGIPNSLLGAPNFIKAIIFQRLIPVVCQHCSAKYAEYKDNETDLIDKGYTTQPVLNRLKRAYEGFLDMVRFRNHKGCPKCLNGISGQEAAVEVLKMDSEIRQKVAVGNYESAKKDWIGARGVSQVMDFEESLDSYYKQHSVGFTAFDHAIKKMLHGKFSPEDVEDKLQPISEGKIMSDGTLSGHEVNELTGQGE